MPIDKDFLDEMADLRDEVDFLNRELYNVGFMCRVALKEYSEGIDGFINQRLVVDTLRILSKYAQPLR